MSFHELCKRYFAFTTGLFFSATGIALVTKAGLGTSPISSLPYVSTFIVPLSFGEWTFIINVLMLAGQIIILRRDFQKIQLLQIPMTVVFSFFIDLVMFLCAGLNPAHYYIRIMILLAGCVLLGVGIALQIVSDVLVLSGEGLVRALSVKTHSQFGTVKTMFDLSLVAMSIILSLVCLRGIEGLREGTVISALIVGSLSRFFIARFAFMEKLFAAEAPAIEESLSE